MILFTKYELGVYCGGQETKITESSSAPLGLPVEQWNRQENEQIMTTARDIIAITEAGTGYNKIEKRH